MKKKMKCTLSLPAVLATSLAVIVSGCAKKAADAATAAPVTVSGTFGSIKSGGARVAFSNASRLVSDDDRFRSLIGDGGSSQFLAFTSYTLHCATADVPPIESDGTINSDGTFSMDITGGEGKGLTCNVVDAAGDNVAQILISDSSKKDMNGNSQINGTPAFSTTTALGSLILDLTTGEVSVPAANVSGTLLTGDAALGGGTPFDPTGKWTIADVDFTLPKGVKGTCPANQHDDSCNGPPLGMALYLKRLQGTSLDGGTVYGMQVWQDEQGGDPESAFTACGSMTGLSGPEKTKAGLLSITGATDGAFAFTTTFTDPRTHASATMTDGLFQSDSAIAQYTMKACVPVTKTVAGTDYNLYVCGPDGGGHYSAGLGGGCVVTSTGLPIKNMDWSKVGNWGSCTPGSSALTGFYKSSCTAVYDPTGAATPITCTNENGVFTDAGATSPVAPQGNGFVANFDYNSVPTLMTKDAPCSGVANALMKVRCYADYYEQHLRNVAGCFPRVEMDWSTTDPTKFAVASFRPNSLVFMDKLTYSGPNSLSMLTRQEQSRGVKLVDSSGNEQWINCGAVEKGGLFVTKVSETRLLATYISATTTTSTEKAACVAATWNGTQDKFFFYLDK